MMEIRFNHLYKKLDGMDCENPWTLLQVWNCFDTDLSKAFLDYDTTFDGGKYKVDAGRKLVLLFQDSQGKLVTTVRTWSYMKELRYTNMMGAKVQPHVFITRSTSTDGVKD